MNEKSIDKVKVVIGVVVIIILVGLVGLAVITADDKDSSVEHIFLSGAVRLEENDRIRFKKNEDGQIYAYITYVDLSNELTVKKVVIIDESDFKYRFVDSNESIVMYKATKRGSVYSNTELNITIGKNIIDRIDGITLIQ